MEWRFPDVRLAARAEQIFERIVATGSLVLRRLGENRAGEVAAHRFLDNKRVGADAIIDTLAARTLEACTGRRVLAISAPPLPAVSSSAMVANCSSSSILKHGGEVELISSTAPCCGYLFHPV